TRRCRTSPPPAGAREVRASSALRARGRRRGVAHDHAIAALEALAEAVAEAFPTVRVLAPERLQQPLLDLGVVHHLARGIERGPVHLADGDPRPLPSRLDALLAPGRRRGASQDGASIVHEPDLGGLPQGARLTLALDVDVLALAERPLEVRGERGGDTRDEDEGKDDDREAAHGGRMILPDRNWFKAPEGGIPAKLARGLYTRRPMIWPRIAVAMAL